MKLVNLLERKSVEDMSERQRHQWAKFIHSWLIGRYMTVNDPRVEQHWLRFSKMFPHDITVPKKLYRLMTIPTSYDGKTSFKIKPSPHNISSWSGSKHGLNGVLDVADDVQAGPDNMRVAVRAMFDPDNILATPDTMNTAFNYLTRDYFDRYPEQTFKLPSKSGKMKYYTYNKGYRDFEPNSAFNMDEIGYTQDKLRQGSKYAFFQDEYIIHSPAQLNVVVIKTYRVGNIGFY